MARTADLEHDHIAYGETAIFVGTNFIISVRHGFCNSSRPIAGRFNGYRAQRRRTI